jgi:hypothetical protein
METYISYEQLSEFGLSFGVDKDKLVEKLNSEGGFSATIRPERTGGTYISIHY